MLLLASSHDDDVDETEDSDEDVEEFDERFDVLFLAFMSFSMVS